MMRIGLTVGFVVAVLLASLSPALAQSASPRPVPEVGIKSPVPGASETPDLSLHYNIVFDVVAVASDVRDINPGLASAARFLNTLAEYGVPPRHRLIAIVIHRQATEIIVNDAAFQASHEGHANPNLAVLRSLKKAGVEIRVCGQAVTGMGIDPATIVPEVQLDFWALTTLLKFQLNGYVVVGP